MTYQPWSLRCLFHPIVLVFPVMKAAVLCGARDPRLLTWIGTLPTIAFSTAGIGMTALLARRWGWPDRAAMVAAFFYAFAWLPFAYGSTPFPRPISTTILLGAFLLVSSPRESWTRPFAAGLLASAAFAVRWSEGVVLIALCGWTAWRFRSSRRIFGILAGFAAGSCLFVGLTDWLTWGKPFASLAEYFRIMYLERPEKGFVTEDPIWDYAYSSLHWAGPVLMLLLIPAWKERRARPAIAVFAAIVALLSLFSHKEWRYLQAAIPFLSLAAAAGWERLRSAGHRFLTAAALVLVVPYGIERALTMHSRRSASEIEASRWIRSRRPNPQALALEQTWAYGEHLYLGNEVAFREIEIGDPLRPRAIRDASARAEIVAVYEDDLDEAGRREIEQLGFRPVARFQKQSSKACLVFGRESVRAAP